MDDEGDPRRAHRWRASASDRAIRGLLAVALALAVAGGVGATGAGSEGSAGPEGPRALPASVLEGAVELATHAELGFDTHEHGVTVSGAPSKLLLSANDGHGSVRAVELRNDDGTPVLGDVVEIDADVPLGAPEAIATSDGGWLISASGCTGSCTSVTRHFFRIDGDGEVHPIGLLTGPPRQLVWIGEIRPGRFVAQLHPRPPDPARTVIVDAETGPGPTLDWGQRTLPGAPMTGDSGRLPTRQLCAEGGRIDVLDTSADGAVVLTRLLWDGNGPSVREQEPRRIDLPPAQAPSWMECRADGITTILTEDREASSAVLHTLDAGGSLVEGATADWTGELQGTRHLPQSAVLFYGESVSMEGLREALDRSIGLDEYLASLHGGALVLARGRWTDVPLPNGTQLVVAGDGKLGLVTKGNTVSGVVLDSSP